MTDHRPLSVWTATVRLPGASASSWPHVFVVNDGDERADARYLAKFAHGWQRRAVPVDAERSALGLVHTATGETVVELDEMAVPLAISETGLRVLSRIERHWPDVVPDAAELRVLGNEPVDIRRLLLARLADEARPPAELFHLLPWHLVGQLAENLTNALEEAETTDTTPVIQLRHWFRPVGSRFTASLEQLDEGVREHDRGLIRVAATSLCARLGELDTARLPVMTRQALAALTDTLARDNRFLGHAAARAAARLRHGEDRSSRHGVRMATHLVDAADSSSHVRRESTEFERPPFTLRLTVSATGRVTLSARTLLASDEEARIARDYGVVLLPVRITDAQSSNRYWLTLQASGTYLGGTISLPLPTGDFVEADVDGPPAGIADAGTLDTDEVERSVPAVTAYSALQQWELVARSLPATHPLRDVIERAAQ
ncbi:hypothetical protein ACFV0T_37520 [Streptomyces sp. NPDC059582]|uniref:hypothetical protein n=1 Tax=Streptomyces sp. NPDC059582 TaxID=3346875 RepID=UPI0036CBC96C